MSINKFIILFVKNKAFFWFGEIEALGFWIFELMVSIVILMLTTLILLRFTCNMISTESDSVNRLLIIDYIASNLDATLGQKYYLGLNIPNFVNNADINKNNCEFKTSFYDIKIVKSTLPESIRNSQKSRSFRVLLLSAACKSAFGFGRENAVKIFTSAINPDFGAIT